MKNAYQNELHYWKKAALEKVLTENGRKQLTDLAPPTVFLPCKPAIKNIKNVHEIIFLSKVSMFPSQ